MIIFPFYDVLHYTNHIFSESWWHPLTSNPLPTHPSPTQTHHTHKTHPQPTLYGHFSTLWCSTLYKPYIFWKLMTPIIQWLSAHSPIAHTDPTIPTNPTHNPFHMKISPHDTNQIWSCCLLFSIPMTTHPLPSKSWHSEFRTVVQGLVLSSCCYAKWIAP